MVLAIGAADHLLGAALVAGVDHPGKADALDAVIAPFGIEAADIGAEGGAVDIAVGRLEERLGRLQKRHVLVETVDDPVGGVAGDNLELGATLDLGRPIDRERHAEADNGDHQKHQRG